MQERDGAPRRRGRPPRPQLPQGLRSDGTSHAAPSKLKAALQASDDNPIAVLDAIRREGSSATLPALTKLVSKFSKQTQWHKALLIYNALPALGLAPDVPMVNAALGACERGRDEARCLEILDGMTAHGLAPDQTTYKVAVQTLARADNWMQCAKLFLRACLCSVQLHSATTMMLIFLLGKARQWQLAEEVLACACARMSGFSFTQALSPPEHLDLAPDVIELLRAMVQWRSSARARSPPPPPAGEARAVSVREDPAELEAPSQEDLPASVLESACDSYGRLSVSASSVSGLEQEGGSLAAGSTPAPPSSESGADGEHTRSSEFGGRRDRASSDSLSMLRACCNALLHAYGGAEPVQVERAVALYQDMAGDGADAALSPDVVSYNLVIRAHAHARDVRGAYGVLNAMLSRRVRPNGATYEALLTAASSAGQHAAIADTWRTMLIGGIEPDSRCLELYVASLLSQGLHEDGYSHFRVLVQRAVVREASPQPASFERMMQSCAVRGDPQAVVNVYRDAVGLAVPVTTPMFNLFISALVELARIADAVGELGAGVGHEVVTAETFAIVGRGLVQAQAALRGARREDVALLVAELVRQVHAWWTVWNSVPRHTPQHSAADER